MAAKNLVLRTVYIDPDIDDELRNQAFAGRTSKNDLFRKYLLLGMQTAHKGADIGLAIGQGPVKSAAARGASARLTKASAKPVTVNVAPKCATGSKTKSQRASAVTA